MSTTAAEVLEDTAPEQRADPRQRVLFSGKIVYGGGSFTADCVIRNVTKTGAKIVPAGGVVVPDDFQLLEIRTGWAHECVVKWRRRNEVGVTFKQSHALNGEVPPHLHLTRRLWVDCISR